MIRVSWNDLPQRVRENAADYWIEQVKQEKKNSVVDALVEEFGGNVVPVFAGSVAYNRYSPLTTMEFTDEQYTLLLLKYR
jgi:hypothetical protein